MAGGKMKHHVAGTVESTGVVMVHIACLPFGPSPCLPSQGWVQRVDPDTFDRTVESECNRAPRGCVGQTDVHRVTRHRSRRKTCEAAAEIETVRMVVVDV